MTVSCFSHPGFILQRLARSVGFVFPHAPFRRRAAVQRPAARNAAVLRDAVGSAQVFDWVEKKLLISVGRFGWVPSRFF